MVNLRSTEPLAERSAIKALLPDGQLNPAAIERILALLENQAGEADLLPGSFSVGTVAKDAIPANPKRVGLWLHNLSDTDMHIGFGWDARTDLPWKLLKSDQQLYHDKNVCRKRISVIHGGAGTKTLYFVELVKP